jgi:hypothetical protein
LGIRISKILYDGLEFFGSGLYFLKCGILGEQI